MGEVFGFQAVQLVYGRLGGAQVLERGGVNRAIHSKRVGDDCAALPDYASPAWASRSRRAEGGAVSFALVGLSEASYGSQPPALCEEGEAACLQCFVVGISREGSGQVVGRRT